MGSTLLTRSVRMLTDVQKFVLFKILKRHNAEPIYVEGHDFFLIRFRGRNLEFNTFLPIVDQIYLKPVLSNDKNGGRWLEILTEIEMEWYEEGHSESTNSLWAWSINSNRYEFPLKKAHATKANSKALGSLKELAVHGIKEFSNNFLETSYNIISIPEHSVPTEDLRVNHIKSARALFFKTFNDIHVEPNTDIYILRKKDGVHYFRTYEDLTSYPQNSDSKSTYRGAPKSIFRPFE